MTAPQALPEPPDLVPLPERGTGERVRRRQARTRMAREEIAVVVVFILALLVTLLMLGHQWLDSGSAGVTNDAAALYFTPHFTRHLNGGST